MMMWMCSFIFLLLGRIEMEKVDCSCNKNYNFRLRWNLYPVQPPTAEPHAHSFCEVLDAIRNIIYPCMLTYLDGMKWNCLAQRYVYASTTTRDRKVIYKPTVHWISQDNTNPMCNFYSTAIFLITLPLMSSIAVLQFCATAVSPVVEDAS